jgi:gamma-glutamyltranspeptidase/glutathione hydrolase
VSLKLKSASSRVRWLWLGTSGGLASFIGGKVLEAGGSALDAAVTTSLCEIVLSTGKWVSLAGIADILYFDSQQQQVFNIQAPWKKYREFDLKRIGDGPAWTVLIPGYMRGLQLAHRNFGKLPLKELILPAAHLARHGFPYNLAIFPSPQQTEMLNRSQDGRILLQQLTAQDSIVQESVAEILEDLMMNGIDAFYSGKFAVSFVQSLRESGVQVTLEDMSTMFLLLLLISRNL